MGRGDGGRDGRVLEMAGPAKPFAQAPGAALVLPLVGYERGHRNDSQIGELEIGVTGRGHERSSVSPRTLSSGTLQPVGQVVEVAHVEVRPAGARVGSGDEDAGESEASGGLQVVVRIRRNVIPVPPESRAESGSHVGPDCRVRLVAADLFGANPFGQIETERPLHLPSVGLVAIRARDARSDPHEAAEPCPDVGVERPASGVHGNRACRLGRNSEDVDEARCHDGGIGAIAAVLEVRLEIDHLVELGIVELGPVPAQGFPKTAPPIDHRSEDVEGQERGPHSRSSSTARCRSAATATWAAGEAHRTPRTCRTRTVPKTNQTAVRVKTTVYPRRSERCLKPERMTPVRAGAIIWGSTRDTCQIPMSFAAASPFGSTSIARAQSTAW